MKAKSVKRLTALLTVLALVVGAGAGFYVIREHRIKKRYAIIFAQGMSAAANGDHASAVSLLGAYLQRDPQNLVALTQYIHSRPLVEAPGNTELADTIVQLRRLLRLDPNPRIPELRQLLQLYLRCGYYTEAATTAEQLLQTSGLGNDPEILRAKFSAHSALHNYDGAEDAVRRWLTAAPTDIDPPISRAWLQVQQHKPTSQVLEDAANWDIQSPADPRRLIVLGAAQLLIRDLEAKPQDRDNDTTSAGKSLIEAAKSLPDDPHVLDVLIEQLNIAGEFTCSLDLLKRAVEAKKIPPAREQLACRYWEMGKFADVVELLEPLDANDTHVSVELLALKGLSMLPDRKPQAKLIATALASRQNDAVAKAWSIGLAAAIEGEQPDKQNLIDALTAAVARDPGHGYLYYFLAQAIPNRDSPDSDIQKTINYLQLSAGRNRTWAAPESSLANIFLLAGQYDAAWRAANEAHLRAWYSPAVQVGYATVWFACVQQGRTDGESLLQFVTNIQKEAIQAKGPIEEQTFLIELSLLAGTSRIEPAQKELRRGLDSSTKFSEATLLQMAAICEQYKLGLTSECLARDELDYDVTPNLAYARAVLKPSNPEGLAEFEALRARAKNPQAIEWRLNWARYLDGIADPRASAAVIALAKSKDGLEDARAQRLAMNARSVQENQTFMDETLLRAGKLLGERNIDYRTACGRYWLQFQPANEAQQQKKNQTVEQLLEIAKGNPRLIAPHVILAVLFDRDGKLLQALEQYQIAANLRPDAAQLQFMLASALIKHKERDKAIEPLKNYMRASKTDPSQSRLAAAMLAGEGERKEAIEGLSALLRQSPDDSGATNLLLAQLYVSDGQADKAVAMCDDLLQHPTAEAIQFVTNLLLSQGQADRAARILDGLDQIKLEPGQREVIRAEYATKTGDPKQALGYYKMAVANASNQPFVWRSYLNFAILSGIEDPRDVLEKAEKQIKADLDMDAILSVKSDLLVVNKSPSFKSVALAFVSQPVKGGPPQELLSLVAADIRASKSPAAFADDLQELATRNQHFLVGQLLAIQWLTASAQNESDLGKRIALYDKAIIIADTATGFYPSAPEPAMLLAASCRECAQLHNIMARTQTPENAPAELSRATDLLQRARSAAQKWRERTPRDPVAADGMIALLQVDLGNSAEASALLLTYLSDTKAPQFGAMVGLYAQIQMRDGHPERASAAMQPLLSQNEAGRRQWIQFAIQNTPTSDEGSWLDRVAPLVGSDSEAQQIFLGEAWNDLFVRTGDQSYAEKARAIIAPLASKPDASPQALFAMGTCEDMADHLDAAKTWYSKLLAAAETGRLSQSDLVYRLAQNNFAMVLAKSGTDLDRAQQMANEAVKAMPGSSSFHDTLSFVQAKRGAYKEALLESQVAIGLQPMEPSLRISRMLILLNDKQLSELGNKLKELDSLNLDLNRLSLEKKRQLEALRGAANGHA